MNKNQKTQVHPFTQGLLTEHLLTMDGSKLYTLGYSTEQSKLRSLPSRNPTSCREKDTRLSTYVCKGASLVAQLVKNLPAMQETQVRFPGWEDSLEKEMTTHSSILAWRIPWIEKPGGLQSMELQELDMT